MPLKLSLLAAVLLLVGCGGSDEGASTGKGTGTNGGSTLVAALGDSITAGSPQWDPDPGFRGANIGAGADERSQYEYWAQRANPGLSFRNCGVLGERTDEIALRLDACAEGADALVIQGGINDIAQQFGGNGKSERQTVNDAASSLLGMVQAGKRLGLRVAITDVLPWNNGHSGADDMISRLNREIAEIGRSEQVRVLPFHATLEDPNEPGVMRKDWTYEGDHPSIEGYRRLGELAFRLP